MFNICVLSCFLCLTSLSDNFIDVRIPCHVRKVCVLLLHFEDLYSRKIPKLCYHVFIYKSSVGIVMSVVLECLY